MSLLSNVVVKLISGKKDRGNTSEQSSEAVFLKPNMELDFSLRNYVKESFSVLIVRPLSGYVMKIIRITSLLIMGASIGILLALLCFGIFLQFGSVENTILSSFIQSKFEKFLPDSDLSMKSARLQWNTEAKTMEIVMNKVHLDDLFIPKVSVIPDYDQLIRQQKLVVKNISITNPKINICVENDFKSISVNPNLEKGGRNKAFFAPISTFNNLDNLLDQGTLIKFINADVSVEESGTNWRFKNVYCEYKKGDTFPRVIDCKALLPTQEYISNIGLTKTNLGENKSSYKIKIESVNPFALRSAFAKRNVPIDSRIFDITDGYNLPVSGTLILDFNGTKFLGGKFDLIGASGSIKLPVKNTLSLTLGKKIDNGSIVGSFSENKAKIDAINISYGNAGFQLTGMHIPLNEFKFLDVVNIDGTLSLTNIDVHEMGTILPENMSNSVTSIFKNYLPGFKLELFKIDLNGPIAFGQRPTSEKLNIGQGIFRIKDAKVPLGEHIVTNVDANGTISDDGFDIRLTHAVFMNTKINGGSFFISNKDYSWIGKVNLDIPANEISKYMCEISPKLASLPLEKLQMKGLGNLDVKLVRVVDDNLSENKLPFRVVEGECTIKSDNNTKELRFSWNNDKLFATGDIVTGKNKISLKIEEDLINHSGKGSLLCMSQSAFLDELIPSIGKMCLGDYVLKLNSTWKGKSEEYDVALDLKNAVMTFPTIGDVKLKKDEGSFTTHITKNDNGLEFSNMFLDTKNNKIKGKMSIDNDGNLIRCSFDQFEIKGGSAKVNILRENDKMLFSAVGDYLDVSRVVPFLNKIDKNIMISAYINLKEIGISSTQKVKNAKGSLDIKGGNIIGGTCYAVIGEDTTIAFIAKGIENTNDTLLSLSASNAGAFLKYFKITDTLIGGSINFVTKTARNADGSFSGAFEISDFVVKNNSQLLKLISLSSTNWIPNPENLSVGFNFCMGNFTIADDQVVIENGRAISPAMAFSFNGSYDRLKDDIGMNGMAMSMSAYLNNNQNSNGGLVAPFELRGSLGMPTMSVRPLKFLDNEILNIKFGNILPITMSSGGVINDRISPPENSHDPFAQGAFDRKANASTSDDDEVRDNDEKSHPQSISTMPKKMVTNNNKFGIKITRGVR